MVRKLLERVKGIRPLALSEHSAICADLLLAGTPSAYSDEEFSKQSRRHCPACAIECSQKIGMAIRRQTLQGLQQWRGSHEGHPDHERPGPSEADYRRDHEIAEEVLGLPTEPRAGLPIGGAQMGEREQGHGSHAAKFQEFSQH